MKLFQKTSVAVALTIIMIAAAIGIGQWRAASADPVEETAQSTGLDSSLSTAAYTKWIDDQANVLTDQQEEQICLFNANWVKRYDSLIALAVVDGVSGGIDDYAYSLGEEIELASSDGILVIDVKNTDGYLAVGPDYPMTDQQVTSYMDQSLYEYVAAGEYGEGVLNLFADINQFYVDNYGLGYLDKSTKGLKVNNVQASAQTALSKQWPVARELYIFTDGQPTGEVKALVDYLLDPGKGQKSVREVGYVPLAH